jgi:hypothetical protein
MNIYPDYLTPEQLADHLGWSARELRRKARELGACRILGNAMILTPKDVDDILEATRPCPSQSTSEATSIITAAQSEDDDYAALLASRTKKKHSDTPSTSKQESVTVVSLRRNRN